MRVIRLLIQDRSERKFSNPRLYRKVLLISLFAQSVRSICQETLYTKFHETRKILATESKQTELTLEETHWKSGLPKQLLLGQPVLLSCPAFLLTFP
jgi:hypothetical protein